VDQQENKKQKTEGRMDHGREENPVVSVHPVDDQFGIHQADAGENDQRQDQEHGVEVRGFLEGIELAPFGRRERRLFSLEHPIQVVLGLFVYSGLPAPQSDAVITAVIKEK
jgi:hypothetical protein